MSISELPYISFLRNRKSGAQFVAIIQDVSKNLISFYDLGIIKHNHELNKVLNLANTWWKTSPYLPISIFYRERFDRYNYARKHCNITDIELISGFKGVRIKDLVERRIKRKLITIG